ncbi:MAG TPA: hypothetical protein EYP04_09245 [Anaerolineae bacterium]|nr:hypothetical protein [Anaerolineae bacterium]HIQ05299.1 hypothetical protein [Anaerolineae bacterium]
MSLHEGVEAGDQDELDALVRWALSESSVDVEPPERVWMQIRRQLMAGPPQGRYHPSPPWRLAPFIQRLAFIASILLLGMGLGSSLRMRAFLYGAHVRVTPTQSAVPSTVSTMADRSQASSLVEPQWDMLSGRVNWKTERERIERSKNNEQRLDRWQRRIPE